MGAPMFETELMCVELGFRSAFLGSRDVRISDVIEGVHDIASMEKVIMYFNYFESYIAKAMQAYGLQEDDLTKEAKDMMTQTQILHQLASQKLQTLKVDAGETPIYQTH